MCTTDVHVNDDFILSESLNTPNLYINWGNMWYPVYQSRKNSICACSLVSRVFIYASNEPLCGTQIINIGKNSICACYCKQIKTSFSRMKWEYKNQMRIQNMY